MVGAVIASQKLRKRCTRSFGALLAIIAALIAPIEIPATQSGVYPEDDRRFVHAGLVAAERATTLQDQTNLLVVGCWPSRYNAVSHQVVSAKKVMPFTWRVQPAK
jgi:hypothetical protein